MRLFGHGLAPDTAATWNLIMRKTAHLTEYGILSALTFRAFRGARKSWNPRWAIGAIVFAALIASIDEIHQSFVPSRTGTWHDVLLDAAGAALGQHHRPPIRRTHVRNPVNRPHRMPPSPLKKKT